MLPYGANEDQQEGRTHLHRASRELYKLSGGRVGGKMQDGYIILLGTTGRKPGKARERPLIAGDHPNGWVVVASLSTQRGT